MTNFDYNKDFAVFILTHGRADNVKTMKSLEQAGFTGQYYIVIDNEDDQEERYRELYGDKVVQFDKLAYSETCDTVDISTNRKAILYARNYCFELAKELNIKYFCELDDDYTAFHFRFIRKNKLAYVEVNNIDKLFEAMCEFLETSGASAVAMAQGGDFIGGAESPTFKKGLLRKAMNSFVCTIDRPFRFIGRFNDDVNTYTTLGSRGKLFFTITNASLVQMQTQKGAGGMSETYLESGTYVKSFYSVICMPSCVKIGLISDKHTRIHHHITWENCVPCIIDEKYKKER